MKFDVSSKLRPFFARMKGLNIRQCKKLVPAALVLLALSVFIAGAVMIYGMISRPAGPIALLPAPEESSPYAILAISDGELPAELFKLLLDSPTVFPSGNSPVITLLPVFKTAKESALVACERENGFVMYGNMTLSQEEISSLSSMKLPDAWRALFTLPEVSSFSQEGVIRVTAANIASPLYIELHGSMANVADSLSDMERIQGVRSGSADAVKTGWKLGKSWGGHLLMSDGGVISALISGKSEPLPEDKIGIEIAWRSSGPERKPHSTGDLVWRFLWLDKHSGNPLVKSIRPANWDGYDIFIPSPCLLSMGLNLPDGGKDAQLSSPLLKSVAERIMRLGLNSDETGAVMSGPAAISIGGTTQLLWFELPGAALELFDRGKVGYKLIDAFWAKLFMGAEPRPTPGYSHGGTTDLPFPIIAACNDKNAVIALAAPEAELDRELKMLLKKNKSSVGWFYADLPKLGEAIANMPSMSTLLSESEETSPTDTKSMELLRESLDKLAKLFVVWESGDSGYGLWYK